MTRARLGVAAAFVLLSGGGGAFAADPPLPMALDQGGTAVALLTDGIDYRDPAIAARLARDGEGEIIGWDFVDNDIRPFADGGSGTALAKLLGPGVRLVPVRVAASDPQSLARGLAFAARTPARIVVVPMESADAAAWEPFRQAALHFQNLLIVAAATGAAQSYPAGLGLETLVAVSTADAAAKRAAGSAIDAAVAAAEPGAAAALAAAAFLSCRGGKLDADGGRAMKDEFLAKLGAEARDLAGEARDGGPPAIAACGG